MRVFQELEILRNFEFRVLLFRICWGGIILSQGKNKFQKNEHSRPVSGCAPHRATAVHLIWEVGGNRCYHRDLFLHFL